jgi:hypothetical protein
MAAWPSKAALDPGKVGHAPQRGSVADQPAAQRAQYDRPERPPIHASKHPRQPCKGASRARKVPDHARRRSNPGPYPALFTTPSAASSPSSRLASFVLAARCGAPVVRLAALLRARPRFAAETELSRRSLVINPGYGLRRRRLAHRPDGACAVGCRGRGRRQVVLEPNRTRGKRRFQFRLWGESDWRPAGLHPIRWEARGLGSFACQIQYTPGPPGSTAFAFLRAWSGEGGDPCDRPVVLQVRGVSK